MQPNRFAGPLQGHVTTRKPSSERPAPLVALHRPLTFNPGPKVLNHGHGPGVESPETLVIGIDFGTTYTGIAYALTNEPTNVCVIQEWKGNGISGRNDTAKVPSLMKYSNSEPITFTWGYEVDSKDSGLVRGIKLGLDPEKRSFYQAAAGTGLSKNIVHQHEETADAEQARLLKSTVDIVADYLGEVYKYALAKIREKEMPDYIDSLRKEFVVTVPAIWSDRAKKATLMAARNAHPDIILNPEDLITEPEAAALFTFQAFSKRGLSKGDAFVLCDAGGGTVDLISYQITSLKPKLQVKEVVSATGGAVGSMMLNNGFERYLLETLGEKQFNLLREGDAYAFNSVMKDFETTIKPNFSSAEEWDDSRTNDKINIPGPSITDDPKKNIRGNILRVKGDVLQGIFDPLVTEIEKLVKAQVEGVKLKISAPPKAVFLVGGFGASPYLKRRLRELVAPIGIIQPNDAWSAVVRGAVLSKMPLAISVVSSVAPKNYGVRAYVPYRSYEHFEQKSAEYKIHDPYEEIDRIPKMIWYILKGADLSRDRKVRFPFHRSIPFDYKPEDLIFEDELQESEAEYPPTYPWQGVVNRNCKLTCDLRRLTKDQLVEGKTQDGTKFYSVEYDLALTIGSALSTFSVEYKRTTYGSVEVDY